VSRKEMLIDDAPIKSWHAILKKETFCDNDITSLDDYFKLVKESIQFNNTTRLKSKRKLFRSIFAKLFIIVNQTVHFIQSVSKNLHIKNQIHKKHNNITLGH